MQWCCNEFEKGRRKRNISRKLSTDWINDWNCDGNVHQPQPNNKNSLLNWTICSEYISSRMATDKVVKSNQWTNENVILFYFCILFFLLKSNLFGYAEIMNFSKWDMHCITVIAFLFDYYYYYESRCKAISILSQKSHSHVHFLLTNNKLQK